MKIIYKKYMMFLLVLFFCCTKKNQEVTDSIFFDTENIEILPLQIEPHNIKVIDLSLFPVLISRVSIIELFDSILIIYDGELKAIDLKNNEIKHLARKGKGPFEYLSVSSIKVKNDGVFFLDYQQGRLQQVSLNGDPIMEIEIEGNPLDFTFLDDNLIAFFHGSHPFNGNSFRVSIFDLQKKEHVSKHLPFPIRHYDYLHFTDWNNFIESGDQIYLSFSGNSNIYMFGSDHELIPKYSLNFGEKTLTKGMLDKDYNEVIDFANQMNEEGIIYRIISTYIFNNMIVFSTRSKTNWYLFFHNMSTKKSKVVSQLTINDSPPIEFNNDLIPKGYFNGRLMFILEPVMVINTPILRKALEDLHLDLRNLRTDSNPVLMLIDSSVFE